VSERTQAVLLDAFGTLVELEPPWQHLAPALGVDEERARAAFLAEMAYYRAHSHEAVNAPALGELRRRCAAVLAAELDMEVGVETMMDAIRFRAFDDAKPALRELRQRGLRLVCASNWDYALGEVLDQVGLGPSLDGVVTSAGAGAAKPDRAVFAAALELAGCKPEAALHVGDSAHEDVAGAGACGIRALLIDRSGGGDIASLAAIAAHL